MLERALGKLINLLAAESMPFHLADKFVINGSFEAFFKGNWGGKACLWNSGRFEVGVLAELFYAD